MNGQGGFPGGCQCGEEKYEPAQKSRSLHESLTARGVEDSCENKRRECVDPWIIFQRKEERYQISVLT
jgi:hypothetical protein